MKKGIASVLLVFCAHLALATEETSFLSPDATRAWLDFDSHVELISFNGAPDPESAFEQIEEQIRAIKGPMRRMRPPIGLDSEHEITGLRIVPSESPFRWLAHYHYRGLIAAQKSRGESVPLKLVLNPRQARWKGSIFCTEGHYFPFGYYWTPEAALCPLKPGTDYLEVDGKITRTEAESDFSPAYERLLNSRGEIEIHALFGLASRLAFRKNPRTDREDGGAYAYRKFRKALKELGFDPRTLSDDEIQALVPSRDSTQPFIEELIKDTPRGRIRVRLVFAQPFYEFRLGPFQRLWKDALENASVVLYAGHTGQGDNLNVPKLEKIISSRIEADPSKYQILHLATCLSYSFYTRAYFEWKKSDLDLLTYAGDEILFNQMGPSLAALVEAIDAWASRGEARTYLEIGEKASHSQAFLTVQRSR